MIDSFSFIIIIYLYCLIALGIGIKSGYMLYTAYSRSNCFDLTVGDLIINLLITVFWLPVGLYAIIDQPSLVKQMIKISNKFPYILIKSKHTKAK